MNRPTSITVIGWILIVFGVFGLLSVLVILALKDNPIMQQSMTVIPVALPVQIARGVVGVAVTFACGIGVLRRQNWARFLYVGWKLTTLVYFFIVSPFSPLLTIPSIVFFLILTYFLFEPTATRYFADAAPASAA